MRTARGDARRAAPGSSEPLASVEHAARKPGTRNRLEALAIVESSAGHTPARPSSERAHLGEPLAIGEGVAMHRLDDLDPAEHLDGHERTARARPAEQRRGTRRGQRRAAPGHAAAPGHRALGERRDTVSARGTPALPLDASIATTAPSSTATAPST